MVTTLLSSLVGRVAVASTVGLVGATGAAAAGVLPDPVQSAFARAASVVGVSLPDPADDEADTDGGAPGELPGGAVAGQQRAAENREAALAHAEAIRTWTDCIRQAASARGDRSERAEGAEEDEDAFDPKADCGDRPTPPGQRDRHEGDEDSDSPDAASNRSSNNESGKASTSRPADAGKPSDPGKPANPGPPSETARPAGAGQPSGTGAP